MGDWDPLLVDTLAKGREVILFDNTGVGLSSGSVPRSVKQMLAMPSPLSRRARADRSISSATRWADAWRKN
jgi:hypothetical protein